MKRFATASILFMIIRAAFAPAATLQTDSVVRNTPTGSAGQANLVVNPAACGSTVAPSWCSGSDIGGWIDAAIDAVSGTGGATVGGKLEVPPGVYTFSTTISLVGHPNIILDCQGASLTYSGDSVAIDALQTSYYGNATGGIQNCNIYSPSKARANVTVIRWGNILNYAVRNNSAWNFNAAGDVAFLQENTIYFTEDSIIQDNQARQTTTGYEFLNNCSRRECTNSHEYTFFKNNYWNSPYAVVSGAAGILVSGGVALQNSIIDFHANVNGPSGGTVVKLATSKDRILRDQIAIQAEADNAPGSVCVENNGGFFANGTLQCDAMANSGNEVVVFGSGTGYIGNESQYVSGSAAALGSTFGSSANILPDSEHSLGSAFWGSPVGSFMMGTSPANTGHTDYGYWSQAKSVSCVSGYLTSNAFTLPPGTYTLSSAFVMRGATTTGCSESYMNVAMYVAGVNVANLYGDKNPNHPIRFMVASVSPAYLKFTYSGFNFPRGSYAVWYAPQIEQGGVETAYKQSLYGIAAPKIVAGANGSVYSEDQWITAGGCAAAANDSCTFTITFPKAFNDANWNLMCYALTSTGVGVIWGGGPITSTTAATVGFHDLSGAFNTLTKTSCRGWE